ncbi:MAG: adenylate/guanylate cyclase domain-containing protein [Actinomycetota bacterium]
MSDRQERLAKDPDEHDAVERAAIAEYLVGRGVPIDEIKVTHSLGELGLLAWRRVYRVAGRPLSIEEAARRSGLDHDLVERLLRALGFPDPRVTTVAVTEDDVETFRFLADATKLLGEKEVLHLARVIGLSMARMAEAVLGSIRINYELPALRESSYTEFIQMAEAMADDLLPRLGRALDRLLRHHLLRVSEQSWDVTPEGSAMTLDLAVGFADMVGFTSRSGELSSSDLAQVIDRFEGSVTDTIAALGGRAVKFIGDEVMFAFGDLYAACIYSLQLVDLAQDEAIPDIRVGLAHGEVISRYGDYYGPVVNIASRLVELAPSGAVFVSKDVAERVRDVFDLEEQPAKVVRGIDQPLEHYRLHG